MQTFLPTSHFSEAAKILDTKRLGKQRVEASQILDIIEGRADNNWKHHPAVRMWDGYNQCLRFYFNVMVQEWINRGFKNTMSFMGINGYEYCLPDWLSDPRLPLSHRGNLLRKNPEYYSQFGWTDADPWAPYFWPVPMKTRAKQKIMEDYWEKSRR